MNKKLTSRIDGRLAAYATLAGAALAAPAIPNADASIVYSGVVNINVPSTTAGVYLNVVTGLFGATQASAPGWDINPWLSSGLNLFGSTTSTGNEGPSGLNGIGAYVGTGTTFFNMAFLAPINGAATYAGTGNTTPAAATPLNLNSSNNLFGFRFVDPTAQRLAQSATAGSEFLSPPPQALNHDRSSNTPTRTRRIDWCRRSSRTFDGGAPWSDGGGCCGCSAWRKRKAA